VEREGTVALVKKGGRGGRQLRLLDLLARISLISNDSSVTVTVRVIWSLAGIRYEVYKDYWEYKIL
jgi:hypothetical protein